MNVQEREQLSTFLQQLAQAQAGAKDEEAQAMIAGTFVRQPDAAYLVVQRALLFDAALQDAQAQIAQLKAQLAQQRPAPSSVKLSRCDHLGTPAEPGPFGSGDEQPACSGGSSCPAGSLCASCAWISGTRIFVQHGHHGCGRGRRRLPVSGNQ